MAEIHKFLDEMNHKAGGYKSTVEGLLANARVTQWQNVSTEESEELLEFFGVPIEKVRLARNRYAEEAKRVILRIEECENEIGNQRADLEDSITPQKIAAIKAAVVSRCSEITGPLEIFLDYAGVLVAADKAIREKLTFQKLLPLAKSVSGHKGKLFETGYQVYQIITDNDDEKVKDRNLNDHYNRASTMEKVLMEYALPEMPAMAHSLIDRNIHLLLEMLQQMKLYINSVLTGLDDEHDKLKILRKQLVALREREMREVLSTVETVAGDLSKGMINLHFKGSCCDAATDILIMLQQMKLFYLTLKNHLVDDMVTRIKSFDSPLNPTLMAEKKTEAFFKGMTGLIRMVRFLIGSFGGKSAISEVELEKKIDNALRTCPAHSFTRKEDVDRITLHIEQTLSIYDKPFPFEHLELLLRSCLNTYSALLQRYFNKFKIIDAKGNVSNLSIGRLVNKLVVRTENLKKMTGAAD